MARRRSVYEDGTQVSISMDLEVEILKDMGIVDADGNALKGVHMFGEVKRHTPNHYQVDVPAAEELLWSLRGHTLATHNIIIPPKYYVVRDGIVKDVEGILFPGSFVPGGYYTTRQSALDTIPRLQPPPPPLLPP